MRDSIGSRRQSVTHNETVRRDLGRPGGGKRRTGIAEGHESERQSISPGTKEAGDTMPPTQLAAKSILVVRNSLRTTMRSVRGAPILTTSLNSAAPA
jgi:hypothetical protein